MADKQTGTGAKGKGHKASEGRGDAQAKNPVSAKNQSKQKNTNNQSSRDGDHVRGQRGRRLDWQDYLPLIGAST